MKSVEFTVAAIAGDQGSERISEANVVLQLVDVNDNAPVFDQVNILISSNGLNYHLFFQESYQVSISEDVLPLTSVVTVHAEDADTRDYGQVRSSSLLMIMMMIFIIVLL